MPIRVYNLCLISIAISRQMTVKIAPNTSTAGGPFNWTRRDRAYVKHAKCRCPLSRGMVGRLDESWDSEMWLWVLQDSEPRLCWGEPLAICQTDSLSSRTHSLCHGYLKKCEVRVLFLVMFRMFFLRKKWRGNKLAWAEIQERSNRTNDYSMVVSPSGWFLLFSNLFYDVEFGRIRAEHTDYIYIYKINE
jgi:hypothetical protein